MRSTPPSSLSTSAHFNVIVSSTVRDLSDYRKEIMDACMRQRMFPEMMEHLPASDDSAVKVSLELVDRADIYLVVFAHRYGYMPAGHEISITEMEYDRAVQRGIPRLIFLIDENVPIKPADFDQGIAAIKLQAFKERLKAELVVNFFTSPADLQAKIIDSLSHYRTGRSEIGSDKFHEVEDIPVPPEPYVAHPYVLLQTRTLIGRQSELNELTDWITNCISGECQTRILNIVAIGGMGKSALMWKWFDYIVPQEVNSLAGRMWWSFQENDSYFENFITCALAYVTGHSKAEAQEYPLPERQSRLLAILDREPFLLALDGFERVLVAYNLTAADQFDARDDPLTRRPEFLKATMKLHEEPHRLRKTADPRIGLFIRRLAAIRASHVLIGTRLYPADLETSAEQPLPGTDVRLLHGLSQDDAVNLWRALGLTGSRGSLLPLFETFDNYPLLIQTLASVVARDRRAPNNFDQWRQAHPGFNPFDLPLEQANSNTLELILRVLTDGARNALQLIAALRTSATYDTLTSLLVGEKKLFPNEAELIAVLAELEDCGLLGWDKRANQYDLHSVVRGIVWNGLTEAEKKHNYEAILTHLTSTPQSGAEQVKNLEDLIPIIERYNTLIGLERYDEAAELFYNCLNEVTLFRWSAPRQRVKLLEALFTNGIEELPSVSDPNTQAFILNALAATYLTGGRPGLAAALYRRHNAIQEELIDRDNFCIGLAGLSNSLRQSGKLREAEAAAHQSLRLARALGDQFLEAVNLGWLGMTLAIRGMADGEITLQKALDIFKKRSEVPPAESEGRHDTPAEATAYAFLARIKLWSGDPSAARALSDRAWQLANVEQFERYVILAQRMLGAVALALDERQKADELLTKSLLNAREASIVAEEVLALIELAELRWRQGNAETARELLKDVWELTERGPFPLFEADAYNLLAQIEREGGNTAAAVKAATKAYKLSWCDGPPFTYHWGIEAARSRLTSLGAPEPVDLPQFYTSNYEPTV